MAGLPSVAQIKAYGNGVFDGVADATILLKRDIAARQYAGMKKAEDYTVIVALHTCHGLATSPELELEIPAGPVTSASAGGVSMSVGVNAVDAGSLKSTPWGRDLSDLLVANGPYVATGRGQGPRWRLP